MVALVLQGGTSCLQSIAALESRCRDAAQLGNTLRDCKQLLTPGWRSRLIGAIPSIRDSKQLATTIHGLATDQWVDFHWFSGNPRLHPALGVCASPPCLGGCCWLGIATCCML
jgi:hypothetical protein